jgi:hypothetical protein
VQFIDLTWPFCNSPSACSHGQVARKLGSKIDRPQFDRLHRLTSKTLGIASIMFFWQGALLVLASRGFRRVPVTDRPLGAWTPGSRSIADRRLERRLCLCMNRSLQSFVRRPKVHPIFPSVISLFWSIAYLNSCSTPLDPGCAIGQCLLARIRSSMLQGTRPFP